MTEQTNNLAIWNAVDVTDPNYTKGFNRGGGFKGTSTNSTYLAKKATKLFGPIGIGWGYNVIDESYQQGQDKDIIHVLRIKFWYVWGDKKGEIEHFGQTQFVGKNKNGYYTDEEAPKKSLTDALSKCLSMLGFAADIFLGLYDDNRYVNDLKRDFRDEDEFAANDNRDDRGGDAPKDSKKDDKPGITPEEADKIVLYWEDEIKKCKTGKEVLELLGEKNFKEDKAKLSKDDQRYLEDKANEKSKALKAAKSDAA